MPILMFTPQNSQINIVQELPAPECLDNDSREITVNRIREGFEIKSLTAMETSTYIVKVDNESEFNSLVEAWHRERGSSSLVMQMAMCLSYQRIIAMGKETALPLIFKKLESEGNEPDHWFWALQALTGLSPVSEQDRGNIRKMAQSWLKWGRDNNYVW